MEHISLFLVFSEGVLSLFSPCIIPVLPVYLGVLSSSVDGSLKDGKIKIVNSQLLKNTVLFLLGVSTTFFILGSSVSVLNYFLASNKKIILIIGGILIVIMGISYMGYINIPFLQKEKKFHIEINKMKPLTAYILGFTFSFGWTPCVGPMLSSVLVMASTSRSVVVGNILILIYTIGFMLPFIIIVIFYNKLLGFLDKVKLHMNMIQKIGGIILIVSGFVMIFGGIGKTFDYTNKPQGYSANQTQSKEQNKNDGNEKNKTDSAAKIKSPDFKLVDQYGNVHKLSDYKGKVVFLNFWATWCPPCRGELPHIEDIYKEYKSNGKDVIILGVVAPGLRKEGSKEDIIKFLSENGYTFPVVFDDGNVMDEYEIEAFPTTFIIDRDGNVVKYVPGAMDKAAMKSLINNVK